MGRLQALRDLIRDARELLTAPPDDPRRAEVRARVEAALSQD